ncbi:MAG: HDOD domain-containing protein [Gammaproteobacteria bacterium]|nr:HDOD domain-containing protein [Gammaproteobacteria bacterium]
MAADISQLEFPKASGSCLKAMEMISEGDTDINALDKIISSDPILASTIIKYGNSPIHRRQSEITNVATAINILGMKNVYNALVMAIMKGYAAGNKTSELILQHCMTISALSSFIASRTFKKAQHDMELIGIMHDLPSLVLCSNYRKEYRELMADISKADKPLEVLEEEIFAVSRAEIIGRSVKEFSFPEKISSVLIANCSKPEIGPVEADEDRYLSILCLSHHIEASVVPAQFLMYDTIVGDRQQLCDNLEIVDTDYSDIIDDAQEVINEHVSQVA